MIDKNLSRRGVIAGGMGTAVAGLAAARPARAQAQRPLRIGVLNDQSGIVADLSGMGTVTAATMAVEDFGGSVSGRPIELLHADHLNKTDVGVGIARQWYDEGVTAIFDIGLTTIALGVQSLAREKNRVLVLLSTASADFTGSNCSPNGIHWTYNSYSQALGPVRYFAGRGAKTWFFMTVDYAYGRNVQRDTTVMIEAAGGRVVGSTMHSFDTKDFASSLVTAQASKADVIALATTTAHAAMIVKQADEFGIRAAGQQVAPLSITLHDVKALGLQAGQGLIETAPYYWDQNDSTRAFAERYFKRFGKMPNMIQASAWGAVTHYLKAVQAAGTDAAPDVMARMKATPVNDFMTKDGLVRADGRVMRDMYILQVKKPVDSNGPWDLEQVVWA
ncbi:MAG: ABC transporter substrate-binding protein [Rhodopila sp.]|jgi:branched-chain amino acid transport system substrate-binding protein